jgi:dTDP-4-amino-4,6-dideoxygalactose transaminase
MKTQIEQLSLLGGTPAFSDALHVGRPNIGDRHRLFARINELLDRRWLTNNGPYVQEFEQGIADRLGVAHCVAMCNGTAALEVAIRALGLSGEVIVPSFTFVATAHALQWLGIRPVFCDVDPVSHTADVRSIMDCITPRTTGLLGVHLWGRPCDIDGLTCIADQHRIKLLFDASHAFDNSYNGRSIGNFGDAEVFSFHATKVLNSFEGGAVVTNNRDLAARMRSMRNFGYGPPDEIVDVGTNAKMSEVSAAMGLTGLEGLDDVIAVNRQHYERYSSQLSDIPGITLLSYNENERNNCQYIVLEIDWQRTGIHRDDLIRLLRAENVFARRYFFPGCHRVEPYRSLRLENGRPLPETERLSLRTLCLPTGPSLHARDVDVICQILRFSVSHASELVGRISRRLTPESERTVSVNGAPSDRRIPPSTRIRSH